MKTPHSNAYVVDKVLPRKPLNLLPLWAIAALALLCLMTWNLDISFVDLFDGVGDIFEYISRYRHPDFSDLPEYLQLMLDTLAMALWGTVLALVIAFILAPLAARNFSPYSAVYRIVRELLNLMRSMPDLVLALIFVAALGLGPFPGILALGVHTAGYLGKFFAESLEQINKGICEGVASTGANYSQRVMFAGWPSILPEVFGTTLYILDRNVRMACILGLVGAGGIGLKLYDSLKLFNYGQSAALILLILATLMIIDYASSWLRRKLA